jgi:hypothetical protein
VAALVAACLLFCGSASGVNPSYPAATLTPSGCPVGQSVMGCSITPARAAHIITTVPENSGAPSGEWVPDVSSYQPNVDWGDVKTWQILHGWKIQGAIFKMGEIVPDPYALQNATDLHKDGMIAIGYWFIRPIGAYKVAGLILTEAATLHIHVVALDEEVTGIQGYAAVITPILERAGYTVVDYHAALNVLDSSAEGEDCWVADVGLLLPPRCSTGRRVGWQFSWTGSIPGIPGSVDLSVSYGLLRLAEPPAPPKPKPKPAKTVCFGKGATPSSAKCKPIVKHHDWLIVRRNHWRTEYGRCIRYADGLGCVHDQHWLITRGGQATKLERKYSA